jgi:hypothetical protein
VSPPSGPTEETDPYRDPDTGILRNLLGITDAAVLETGGGGFQRGKPADFP